MANGRFGGGGFFRQGNQERKGHNIEIDLFVTLEELYLGKSLEVEINRQIICPTCRGSGAKSHEHIKTCTSCRGSGVKIVRQQFAPGIYQQMQTHCNVCGGKGKVISAKCSKCQGAKVTRGSNQITVFVEKGMYDGQRIVYEGESDESPDMAAGDVVFVVREQSHPLFTRKGILF
jgi:DnaJ-related protein SCJ1